MHFLLLILIYLYNAIVATVAPVIPPLAIPITASKAPRLPPPPRPCRDRPLVRATLLSSAPLCDERGDNKRFSSAPTSLP